MSDEAPVGGRLEPCPRRIQTHYINMFSDQTRSLDAVTSVAVSFAGFVSIMRQSDATPNYHMIVWPKRITVVLWYLEFTTTPINCER